MPYCDPGHLLFAPSVFQRCRRGSCKGGVEISERAWHIVPGTFSFLVQGHLVAAAPVSPLGSLAGFVYRCFQMKHLFVFQLLADKCRAFIASDIKVLGIYFESEAKNICIGIFLNLFF